MTKKSTYEELEHRIQELEKVEYELKQAEIVLKEQNETLQTILDNIPVMIFFFDGKGQFRWMNSYAESTLGWSSDEGLQGDLFVEYYPDPEYRKYVMEFIASAKRGIWAEFKTRTREGRVLDTFFTNVPLTDGSNIGIGVDITERKRAEEELRESEDKYRNLIESLQEGIWVIDKDSMTTFVNIPMADMLGYTVEEMLGRHLFSFMDEMGVNSAKRLLERRRDGIKEQHEFEFLKKDGARICALMETTALTNKGGNYNGAIAGVINITERKRMEEALQKERDTAQRYLDLAGVIFVAINKAGEVTLINPKGCEVLGYNKEEVVGKNWFENFIPDWLKEDLIPVSKQLLNGGIEGMEYHENPILTKDGKERMIAWHNTILRDEKGNIIGHLSSGEDITERKLAEEALWYQTEKYRILISNIPGMVYRAKPDWYTEIISSSEMLCGYSVNDFNNQKINWLDLIHPDNKQRIIEEASKLQERPLSIIQEYKISAKDGSTRWVSDHKTSLFKEDGSYIGVDGIVYDITEHKRLEEELLRAQKLESVGVLAGGIAHDFNNILTMIMGNVSLAKNRVTPEDEMFEMLSEAETASTRAQALTRQLLTFAKGGSPVKESTSIKNIIRESSLFVLRGSKSKCEFSITKDLWPAEVDVGQISQVINNIVVNANQAMPEGGIIQVAAENLTIEEKHFLSLKPGRYIRISIKDQGVGIAEKHRSKIFDPYFTTKQEGSGLGLATAYSIIKKHDGDITVESKLGEGTTFHIYLPALKKAIPEKDEVKLIKGQGRILVMDDEASLRKMVGRMLEKLGYEPEFAEDGAKAIEMYKTAMESGEPYDAVILDLTVPGGMGGRETIYQLLELDPEVKAIVSSGYHDDPVLANFQDYCFKGMMPKPFESRSLSKVLHEVLQSEKE